MKVNMMVQRLVVALLVVALVGLVRAEDAKEVVVASAEELKGIKAKKIIWKKDGAKMVRIPFAVFDIITGAGKYGFNLGPTITGPAPGPPPP